MKKFLKKIWLWFITPTIEISIKCKYCQEIHKIRFKCSSLPQEIYDKYRGNPTFEDIKGDLNIS